VIDIAALRQPRRTEEVLDDAVHKGLTTARRIADHLGAMPTRGRTGARHLWELLAERTGDPDERANAWENAMARLLASSDLPRAVRQHKVVVEAAVYYLDFAWPQQKVAVECDSVLAHSSGAAFRYDLDRQHDCESLGWTFKRFVPSQLRDDPQGTLAKIRSQLLSVGWSRG
jgi:very-short-patch-repair endonuclease